MNLTTRNRVDLSKHSSIENIHTWLRLIEVSHLPGPTTPVLEIFASNLLNGFQKWGHTVQDTPHGSLDILLTTATYGEPVSWRRAPIFTARKHYQLQQAPTVFTMVHMNPVQLQEVLGHFETVLAKQEPQPGDYPFPGLAPEAYLTLYEQGQRGGPILALERLLQAQTKSIRILLVVGDQQPLEAYTFDLVGAYPRSDAKGGDSFYDDLVLRIVTAVSTLEITDHEVIDDPIPNAVWKSLTTPGAMQEAGRQLGLRGFFSEMVNVANLVTVPAVPETVATQYSEGCFATWDPILGALIATATGSARPVHKYDLSEDDLAVIVGVRPNLQGAQIRHVEGKSNTQPSSEAVELIQMDNSLPRINLGPDWVVQSAQRVIERVQVPVLRSKLHGHRGVSSYDANYVEHVELDAPYYHFPVSCATGAQAHAIVSAFARSHALVNPEDPRKVVFTVLPGHGIVIAEKWVTGKAPLQVIWEYMDAGYLKISSRIPQGPLTYARDEQGKMVLQENS